MALAAYVFNNKSGQRAPPSHTQFYLKDNRMIIGKKPLIAGNWKMNGNISDLSVAERIANHPMASEINLCLFPPVTLLGLMKERLKEQAISLGAQDCSSEALGAFTGDIGASMIKDLGADWVILGHSERRHGHAESSNLIKAKIARALEAGLIPIVCIGETLAQRQADETISVLKDQIYQSLSIDLKPNSFVLAYEPVWAIGTGLVASRDDIEKAMAAIKDITQEHLNLKIDEGGPSLIYGGSVKGDNAQSILEICHVNGLLVGGASLSFEAFAPIIEAGALVA